VSSARAADCLPNIANLLLARAVARRRKSPRWRWGGTRTPDRQLLTESVLLATLGGAAAAAGDVGRKFVDSIQAAVPVPMKSICPRIGA
jgi:hypothetical protein